MPGKTARALCPVCQEPMPPDETECENCGAFVIDEAVVRLCRAFGIPREKALALFEKGFRHPKQLQDRNVDDVLQRGENGLLFLCTNCGGFVATGDSKCPRCSAEFETETEGPAPEKDILDLTLCPVCGADNEATWKECEICGEPLGGTEEPPGSEPTAAPEIPAPKPAKPQPAAAAPLNLPDTHALDRLDDILEELDQPAPARAEGRVRPIAKLAKIAKPKKPTPLRPRKRAAASAPTLRPVKRPDLPNSLPPSTPRLPPKPLPAVNHRPSLGPRVPSAVGRVAPPQVPPKRVREKGRPVSARTAVPSELSGGLVVAGAASLYLSNLLGQTGVAWGVAFVATVVAAYVAATAVLRRSNFFRRSDALPLLAGAALSAVAPVLSHTLGLMSSAAGAVALAWATRALVNSDSRDLIVAAAAVPLAVLGVVAGLGLASASGTAWSFGLLAITPWPAAVAAVGLRRRQSTVAVDRELSKAERHLERQDYAQSVRDFDRAIALGGKGTPGAEMPWYGKGASLILLGRYDEALRAIDKALDLNPRNEVAWLNKGNALTKMGRLVDALRCFDAAIKVNPRYEVAWNNKGNALARLGHFEEALGCYERAIDLDPGYRGAWVNKGYVLTKLGRYDEATSCADRALRLNEGVRSGAA